MLRDAAISLQFRKTISLKFLDICHCVKVTTFLSYLLKKKAKKRNKSNSQRCKWFFQRRRAGCNHGTFRSWEDNSLRYSCWQKEHRRYHCNLNNLLFLKKKKGVVLINDKLVSQAERKLISYVVQKDILMPTESVYEVVKFHADMKLPVDFSETEKKKVNFQQQIIK